MVVIATMVSRNDGSTVPFNVAVAPYDEEEETLLHHQHKQALASHRTITAAHCFLPADNLAYIEVRPEDVLCTKGRHAKSHPGNQYYDSMVQSFRQVYQASNDRNEKGNLTSQVIEDIKNRGGRFLKYNTEKCQWLELSKGLEREKVSHALRSSRRHDSFRSSGGGKKSFFNASSSSLESSCSEPMPNESGKDERLNKYYRIQQKILQKMFDQSDDASELSLASSKGKTE